MIQTFIIFIIMIILVHAAALFMHCKMKTMAPVRCTITKNVTTNIMTDNFSNNIIITTTTAITSIVY